MLFTFIVLLAKITSNTYTINPYKVELSTTYLKKNTKITYYANKKFYQKLTVASQRLCDNTLYVTLYAEGTILSLDTKNTFTPEFSDSELQNIDKIVVVTNEVQDIDKSDLKGKIVWERK
ncbi:hypothetical protein GIX45_17470 [Erwinia sp. CPCC 100877]|nr:hypothetical protein [Erwinia sp. CPCC 100877]